MEELYFLTKPINVFSLSTKQLGTLGEQLAADYLVERNFTVLEKNWRNELGELDLVTSRNDILYIFEIKTRRTLKCGTPLEAVDSRKYLKLRSLTLAWLQQRKKYFSKIYIGVIGIFFENDHYKVTFAKGDL